MSGKKFTIGQKAERSMHITTEMVQKYAEITGDFNPLHFDKEFTKKTKYGRLIAPGEVITGVLNAIVAMDVPGPGTVFMHEEYDFKAPVYIGDYITGSIEIYDIHPTKPVTKITVKIVNQKREVVLEGKLVCYTFQV